MLSSNKEVQLRHRPDLSRYLGDAPERSPLAKRTATRDYATSLSWMVHLAVAHQDESQVLLHPLISECEVAGRVCSWRIWERAG
jgi:hypothetical protein